MNRIKANKFWLIFWIIVCQPIAVLYVLFAEREKIFDS